MPLTVIRNDITKMNVDVIVNAANTNLQAGGGVCGAIFNAAGADRLQKACDNHAPIQSGEAIITKGYALPAKYIIHAAGPVYRDGKHDEEALLRSCYENALNLAKKHKCESIAFPLISSGIYGYPKEDSLAVATNTISKWLMNNEMDVSLVVFDKAAFSLSTDLLGEVKAFINENYVDEREQMQKRRLLDIEREARLESESCFLAADRTASLFIDETIRTGEEQLKPEKSVEADIFDTVALPKLPSVQDIKIAAPKPSAVQGQMKPAFEMPMAARKSKLDDVVARLDEPFSATLLRIIDIKGKTDVEIYKRANLDRKLFSKIRTGKGYMPSKKTVVALAVALELSLVETRNLMARAGFALSRSVMFDVIIEYFITRKSYDIYEINNVLFEYDQPLLGG